MVSSKQVPLSEAYWFQEGPGVRNWQFTTSGVKLLNVGNITKDGNIDLDKTDKHISLDEAEGKYSHFLVDEGDLVIASSGISFDEDGMLRTRGAFIEKKHLPLCLNTSTIRFKAIEGVSDLNFFKFWLDSFEFRDQVSRLVTGSAQQNFGPSHLKIINISLPPLTEQKRIASLLARADRLRFVRRTAHDLSDSVLQSVFLEMFYNTESKWELSTVEDLAKKKNNAIRTGPFGSQLLHSEFTETGDVLVLGIDNAVQNEFSWGKPRYITTEKYQELKRYTVFPGDLIITIMATNGRVAVVPDNIPLAINTKHLCCITLDQKVCLPKFLQACFLYHPTVLEQMGGSERGAVMPGMNMEIIKNLVVPVPPLSLQEEFAGVVARVESLRGRMGESTRGVEGLFESLLAQSFAN